MLFRYAMLLLSVILHNFFVLKGVVDCFFLGFIVFMGCSLTSVNASFKKNIIFHISYLYSTPLCTFSDKLIIFCFYEAPPSEIRDGLWLVSWLSVLWLAKRPLVRV